MQPCAMLRHAACLRAQHTAHTVSCKCWAGRLRAVPNGLCHAAAPQHAAYLGGSAADEVRAAVAAGLQDAGSSVSPATHMHGSRSAPNTQQQFVVLTRSARTPHAVKIMLAQTR